MIVHWAFRGFWKGEGRVEFSGDRRAAELSGRERISVRALGPPCAAVEPLGLERRLRAVWEHGWRRLARREAERRAAYAPTA